MTTTLTPAPHSNVTLSRTDLDFVEARLTRVLRFAAADEAHRTPRPLIAPHTLAEWVVLSPDARTVHIRDTIHADRRAVVGERLAKREARAATIPLAETTPPPEPTPAPLDPAPPVADELAPDTGWHVACSGGCGTWLHARPGRPVVAFCTPHDGQRTYAKRRRVESGILGNKPKRARTRAVCHGTTTAAV